MPEQRVSFDRPEIGQVMMKLQQFCFSCPQFSSCKPFRTACAVGRARTVLSDYLTSSAQYVPADHRLIEDLKRKDLIGLCELKKRDVLDARFLDKVAGSFTAARPLMRFLCEALNVPF